MPHDEVQLTAFHVASRNLVETVAPVETQGADYVEVYANADSNRTFYVEGIKFVDGFPAVPSLEKAENENLRRGFHYHRVS